MGKVGNQTCLVTEGRDILSCQMHLQDFDGRLGTEMKVLPQVDFCEASLS